MFPGCAQSQFGKILGSMDSLGDGSVGIDPLPMPRSSVSGSKDSSSSGTPRSEASSSSSQSTRTTRQQTRSFHDQKKPDKARNVSPNQEEEYPGLGKQFYDQNTVGIPNKVPKASPEKPQPLTTPSSLSKQSSDNDSESSESSIVQEPHSNGCRQGDRQIKPTVLETDFPASPPNSIYAPTLYTEAKESFTNLEVSESHSSIEKSDVVEDRKSNMYRGSTGSDLSDESSSSGLSNAIYKPHKANDVRWEAIQLARSHYGVLGLHHFKLLKKLGSGDIGSVYMSELRGMRSHFAMKVMDKAALAGRKKLLRAQTEREILQSLDHPFLPTLYAHFETDNHSCLVMEFCPGGDLHNLRQRQPGKYFPENAVRFYVAEILLALEYLHMLGIIYRDLKPENVLVREDGHIMLSDFDLSLRCAVCPTLVRSSNSILDPKGTGYCVKPACMESPSCIIQPDCIQPTCFGPMSSKSKKEKKAKTKRKPQNEVNNQVSPLPELIAEPTGARSMSFVGTHEYLAPEIIKGEGHGSAVDWWTLGIFLYELLFGKTPFKGDGNRATLFNVVGQPLRFPESPSVSFAARDLMRGLLVKEPQHRFAYRRGATEIKQHPFFQSVNWALIRCASPPDVPKPVVFDYPICPPGGPLPQQVALAPGEIRGIDTRPPGNYYEIDFF